MDAKLTFILTQQTPMIHFQWKEDGAILRASDVKPRLDSFIYEWVRKNSESKSVKEEWKIDSEHKALNYKMKFVIPQSKEHGKEKPQCQFPSSDLYFGNMGQNVEKKKTVFYKGDIELQIICFYDELREILINCMETFFLTHNFGTRQNRGLGGFALKEIKRGGNSNIPEIKFENAEERLKAWYGEKTIYKIDYRGVGNIKSEDILYDGSVIYKILKSGINENRYIKSFLTTYFLNHSLKIAGDKRFMKAEGHAPKVRKEKRKYWNLQEEKKNKEYRYIRGLLGITESVSFIDKLDDEDQAVKRADGERIIDKVNIKGYEKDEKGVSIIQRNPSPVFYKIHNNILFIIPQDPPEEILGQSFVFTAQPALDGEFFAEYSSNPPRKNKISIPTAEEFKMDDLWDKYVKYLNDQIDTDTSILHQYNNSKKNANNPKYRRTIYFVEKTLSITTIA